MSPTTAKGERSSNGIIGILVKELELDPKAEEDPSPKMAETAADHPAGAAETKMKENGNKEDTEESLEDPDPTLSPHVEKEDHVWVTRPIPTTWTPK